MSQENVERWRRGVDAWNRGALDECEKSGVEVGIKWAHVITFPSGDQHIRSYASWDDALKAVGLEE